MTVYILFEQWGDYESEDIVAVFSTREGAEAEAALRQDPDHPARPSYSIRAITVRDNCSVCRGERGGVPGNENRIDGTVMCDYCSVDYVKKMKGPASGN
jgi:hypothetical protein